MVISTVSWLGGKNDFLGYAYIAVGSICIVLALAFLVKHIVSPRYIICHWLLPIEVFLLYFSERSHALKLYDRPLGDMRYFNFHNQNK